MMAQILLKFIHIEHWFVQISYVYSRGVGSTGAPGASAPLEISLCTYTYITQLITYTCDRLHEYANRHWCIQQPPSAATPKEDITDCGFWCDKGF